MAYVTIYANWLPYGLCNDKRGFISKRFEGSHTGVDSVCNLWTAPICAIFDGFVTDVSYTAVNGWSVSYVSVNGRVKIRHYHLQNEISVSAGQEVSANSTKLAFEGNTGSNSKGKHLHTSMWIDGVLCDPEPYLGGKKELPLEEKKSAEGGDSWQIRRVIRDDLNLRVGAGVNHTSLGKLQKGSYFFCDLASQVTVNGAVWTKVSAVLTDGKAYHGWSNIGDTWSRGIACGE